ncbi:hypothetical protein [Qingshengfaniella alkalisoli]|uniref:Uncharacterized protein n=1 Tax=Qingshengfaniella alkalisoli TaxID=2599296 RepID=A0A5B8IAX9_9RHOB|nr:hypothetical protein [Qingshengfaniella alkalisoli]QDY71239.1 hypothetical protein FPZ52_16255 [Qingshengfaniella alkalisoli]
MIAVSALAQAAMAQSTDGRLSIELNKFEETDDGACQAYFLFGNDTGLGLESFELSLAILDSQGVIDSLLTIDASPLPPARTTLKLFAIPEISCSDISEILLHDIPACKPQNADPLDCFDLVDLDSKASAPLVK